jgi:hypothetical protein
MSRHVTQKHHDLLVSSVKSFKSCLVFQEKLIQDAHHVIPRSRTISWLARLNLAKEPNNSRTADPDVRHVVKRKQDHLMVSSNYKKLTEERSTKRV